MFNFKSIVTVADIVKSKNAALAVFTDAQAKLKAANEQVEQFKAEANQRIAAIQEELKAEQQSLADAAVQQGEIEKTFNRIQSILE